MLANPRVTTAQPAQSLKISSTGQSERATQNRVIALFRDELGYRYLDVWTDRDGNPIRA